MRFRNAVRRRGAAAIQIVVLLVPVLFAFIGFAVDLGIMYSIKGELKAAASSMALAAAQQLIGTDASNAAATTAAQVTIDTGSASGNRYYFHGLPIGITTGTLVSTVSDPVFYGTAADAIANGSSGQTGGSASKYVRVTMTGQTQLLFWSFLPLVTNRNVTVAATAVAGISAPLCQACGIEPFAVAAVNAADTMDYGFLTGTKYSFGYLCNPAGGVTAAPILAGASQAVSYVLLNRFDTSAAVFPAEDSQVFRDGAGGLPGNTNSDQACFRVNNSEVIWASAVVGACNAVNVAPTVTDALCGLDTRFESTPQPACSSITSVDTLAASYQPDPDTNDYDVYTDYTGNGRRIITIPIVDGISASGSMTVLGFRQFLVLPNQTAANIAPGDQYGRFIAMYIGSAAPVKQGRFDGCQQSAGPGKVVLHQ